MITLRSNPNKSKTRYSPKPNPRVHVMIYTYNKYNELGGTLRSLAKTEYGNYKVFVLNNGSQDRTESYLYSIKGKLFNEFKIISLPVNIGAPPARNWLVCDPENAYADFVAFLDDDIILPPNWLRSMVETFERYPDAGVVGAKVLFSDEPKTIQHTGGVITKEDDWIHSIQAHSFERDLGQHDYIARRHYVMGCAQLYRKEVFDVAGMYDIRFAPHAVRRGGTADPDAPFRLRSRIQRVHRGDPSSEERDVPKRSGPGQPGSQPVQDDAAVHQRRRYPPW